MLQGTYFDIRTQTGDGVGYRNSFSQIGAFTPYWFNEDMFLATNTRLIITNSTQVGVNTGLVGRRYVDSLDRIFGVNGYYDNDENSYNYRYSQFTLGAETLGQWWDLRANGYFLNGMRSNTIQALGVGGNPYFTGNELAFRGYNLVDQSMGGGDVEFGVPVSPQAQWLRAYSGIYAYRTAQQNTFGYRGRMEAMVSNDLTLGVMIQQDRLWGTTLNATVDFKFSGFQPTHYFPNLTTRQRMLNPVQRNWRVATHTYNQAVDVAAINPATNRPYFITHVEQGPNPGNGTFQSPFNKLPPSAPGDIILVHAAHSAIDNPIPGSIALSNNQRLLGDGILSTVPLYAKHGNTIYGTFNLPGTSNTGIYPFLSNTDPTLNNGNIVSLASNNEVAGLNMLNSAGTAITNNPAVGSMNFYLHDLQISNNGGSGISLANASGSGIISNINVDGTNNPNPFGYGGNAKGGIQISSGYNPNPVLNRLDLFLTNVSMNGDQKHPEPVGISLTADANPTDQSDNVPIFNVTMNNVFANGNGTGIQLSETHQQLTANMNFVRASNNTNVGIQVMGTGGSISITGENVAAKGNGFDNLQIGSAANPIVTSTVGVSFNDSNFTNSVAGSGVVFSQSGGVGTLNLVNTYVFGNGTNGAAGNVSNGLGIYATNGTLMNANVQTNLLDGQGNNLYGQMQGNLSDAFHVEGSRASTINLYVNHTDASSSGSNGLYYNLSQGTVFNAVLLNSNLSNSGATANNFATGNGGSAMYGQIAGNSVVNLYADQTTGASSGGDGFYLKATGGSFANVEIDHGSFANSGQVPEGYSAVNIVSDNSTITYLSNLTPGNNIKPNGLVGNQAYGLTLDLKNNSLFNGNIYNGDFSDTKVDALNVNVASGSTASLTLLNTPGERSGLNGFVANVDNAQLTTNFTNSNFDSSGHNGMNFSVSNGGTLTSQFNNSSFNNSGADGINGTVTGTNSTASIVLMNGSVVNNSGNNGINFNLNGGTLNLTAISSSISNNGLNTLDGSGVLGVLNNGGVARLDFENTAINRNAGNGVFVISTTGSIVEASFNLGSINSNGTAKLATNSNDGIRLNISQSPFSSLQVFNGTTINGNGNDGISIVASNGTNFVGSLGTDLYGTPVDTGISILNNGVAPSPPFNATRAGVNVTSDSKSLVKLNVDGATIGNTSALKTQKVGFLFNANSGGALNSTITSTNLSNNGSDAINGSVSGPGSIADITLNNVTGNTSGATGAIFNIAGGGQLNVLSGTIGSSLSQNGGSGILVQVDGANSAANFDLVSLSLNNNGTSFGGQGFNGLATNGGSLNVCLESASINNNANQGILINALNANSVANFNVQTSTIDTNGSEGLSITVQDQAVVNYRSVGNTYNGNGTNGTLDGVKVVAIGNGPADSATARLLFSGDIVNANKGSGFSLDAENGATLTTVLENGVASTNNGGYGVLSSASGANTSFNLLMNGANTFTGNTKGAFNPYVFSNMKQVVLDITGSFNNSTSDGVHVDLQNITNAVVAIEGPGTIDGSAGNGISVNMQNITNGSLLIDGFTSISNSKLDGIHVNFDTVQNGAIQIEGPTTVANNGGDGININLLNTNLVNNLNFGGATVDVLTLNSNLASPLDGCLPAPVTVALNSLGNVPVNALTIDQITATSNGGDGILITGTNSNIAANGSFITNNLISGSTANSITKSGGDGLHLNFQTVTADGLVISNNGFQGNAGNGINLELFDSPINNLTIVGNTGGQSGVAGTLNFQYVANGPLNLMANTSTAGIDIANVTLNLAPSGQYYRPDQTFTPIGTYEFFPAPPTDVTVGLDSVDGVAITPGNYPVQDTNGNVLPYGGVPVDSQQLSFGFNNFTPAAFAWQYFLAHGENSSVGNVINTSIVGATGTVTLTDGRKVSGVIKNINGFDQLVFNNQAIPAISPGISSNGLDGIRFNLNNSSLTNLNVSNNGISGNGVSATPGAIGHGIEFTGATGAVVNSDITNALFNANTINSNSGDGIRLVNPTTVGNTISAVFSNNTVSQNAGTGINLSLVTGAQNLQASFASNTISNNAGGPGVNIHLADNRNMTGGFDSNVINLNGAQGVNFTMGVNGQVTSNFTDNTINGNSKEGINIGLNTGGNFEGAQFYGNTIGTAASRNGGMGVRLTVPDQASFNWNIGDSTKTANLISGNTDAGVGIDMTGNSSGNLQVHNTTFSNTTNGPDVNFNGDGLAIRMNNTAVLNDATIGTFNAVNSIATNDVTFASNAGNGLSILGLGNATMQNLLITNVNATGNTGDGINITRIGSPIFTNTTIQNSQIRTNANGIHLIAGNALLVDDYAIQNNQIVQNRNDGVLIDVRFDAQIVADITSNLIDRNGADGIHLIEQQNASTDNRLVSGTWTLNTITNNTGNGIQISAASDINIGASTTQVDNLITGNGLNGILINGVNTTSNTVIQGNVIEKNGTNGISVNATSNFVTIDTNMIWSNSGDAIQLFGRNGAELIASVDNNSIRFNTGDGIKINSSGQVNSGATFDVAIGTLNPNGNDISDNSGHGINILNQANGLASVTINNNAINRNGLEGVYVVNTASATQGQNSTINVVADGSVFDHSQLQFAMDNNSVLDNGHLAIGANFSDTTGLYLRVGTNGDLNNGGFGNSTDPGGFASNATAANSITTATLSGRGGVLALITHNVFGGNAGHDVAFEGFTSTVAPVTGGTTNWTDQNETPPNPANDVYNPAGYQADPLARLDLQFVRNSGQDANVSRSGATYQSVDPIWKSRIGNDLTVASPPGPFDNGGSRIRNAQRQASRSAPFNAPNSPLGASFLYPGVGTSTFRVSSDSNFNVAANPNTNNFGTNDQFTTSIPIGGVFGELPFVWTTNLAP